MPSLEDWLCLGSLVSSIRFPAVIHPFVTPFTTNLTSLPWTSLCLLVLFFPFAVLSSVSFCFSPLSNLAVSHLCFLPGGKEATCWHTCYPCELKNRCVSPAYAITQKCTLERWWSSLKPVLTVNLSITVTSIWLLGDQHYLTEPSNRNLHISNDCTGKTVWVSVLASFNKLWCRSISL